jgi:serpin B
MDMKIIGTGIFLIVIAGAVGGCWAMEKAAIDAEPGRGIIIKGNNQFALELYGKLREKEGNLFLSPYSISTALALTFTGARGRTESQMAEVLHFPVGTANKRKSNLLSNRRQFADMFGKVISNLNERGKEGGYELSVANALWPQKGYDFLDEFIEIIKTNYDGRLNEVDFITATEEARRTINAWVEEKTNDKIKELIKPGVLDSMTRLVLTNAIYFKGNWARQFEEEKTRNAPFTLVSGEKVDVPMMYQTAEFNYMEDESVQVLELPYVDEELSLIILLPKDSNGLGGLEKKFNEENLSEWLGGLHKLKVIVSIPKFKMTSQFSLAAVLKSMGMVEAFTDAADFAGMNGNRDLSISAVIHKAYVDINEEGTEAAAATGVTMRLTSVGPTPTPVFRADHPFLFLIRDNHTDSILFIGRQMNPSM